MLIIILIPLISIFLLPIRKISRISYYSSICLLGLINILLLLAKQNHHELIKPAWGLAFMMDRYSFLFALIVNAAWIITTIYSYSYIKYNFQQKDSSFHYFTSLAISLILSTGFAGNLVTLFVFYVLSIPVIYPLITLRKNAQARKAGKSYLLSTLIPAFVLFLPAVIIYYKIAGGFFDFDSSPLFASKIDPKLGSLLLIMFVIGMSKNCIMPFHTWLPETMVAPAPSCALIHSIAAVQTGSIALIKVAVYIYGLDFLKQITSNFFHAGCLIYLCGITAIYAAIKALYSDDLKVRFSYSTVSQLSYIISVVLVSTPAAILGGILHMISHSIAKINLFFIVGFYNSIYGTNNASKIGRIAPYTPWLVVSIAISGLSIAGFPFLAGYYSKDLMLLEELHSGNYAAAIFLILGSVINFMYIYPIIQAAFFNKKDPSIKIKPMPLTMRFSIATCTVIIILLSFYTYYIIRAYEVF